MFEQTSAALVAATTEAVDTLRALLLAESEQARATAARAILSLALPWRGAVEVEVEAQLADLREQVAQLNAGPNVRRLR